MSIAERHVRKTTQADRRGRITLGREAMDKSFEVDKNERGQFVLTPVVQIPEHEAWLYKNPEVLAMVNRGIAESKVGLATSMGSFAQYADIDTED